MSFCIIETFYSNLQYNPTSLCIYKSNAEFDHCNFTNISPCLSKHFRELVECLNKLSALLAV